MKSDLFAKLKKELQGVKKNIYLARHTTFCIGGPAEYFFVAKTEKSFIKAVSCAKKLGLPLFVFGGGSNLLVSDKGIKGLTMKIQIEKPIVLKKGNIVEAPAGLSLGQVVKFSINKYLQGLEWAGGLPGTLGGAIRGNAGAFGGEIKDSIFKVRALDNNFKVVTLSRQQCQFSYRNSIFKKKNWVVLSASLKLKKGNKKELKKIADSHIAYRQEKHPLEYPNAGSIFKNVDAKKIPEKFRRIFANKIKKDPFEIVPAAWFIIGAGLAGRRIGRAQISQKHSNYIVNLGRDAKKADSAGSSVRGAKTEDVLKLIALTQLKVKEKYGIKLDPEVQFVEE